MAQEHTIIIPFYIVEYDEGDKIEIQIDGDSYIGTIHYDEPEVGDSITIEAIATL